MSSEAKSLFTICDGTAPCTYGLQRTTFVPLEPAKAYDHLRCLLLNIIHGCEIRKDPIEIKQNLDTAVTGSSLFSEDGMLCRSELSQEPTLLSQLDNGKQHYIKGDIPIPRADHILFTLRTDSTSNYCGTEDDNKPPTNALERRRGNHMPQQVVQIYSITACITVFGKHGQVVEEVTPDVPNYLRYEKDGEKIERFTFSAPTYQKLCFEVQFGFRARFVKQRLELLQTISRWDYVVDLLRQMTTLAFDKHGAPLEHDLTAMSDADAAAEQARKRDIIKGFPFQIVFIGSSLRKLSTLISAILLDVEPVEEKPAKPTTTRKKRVKVEESQEGKGKDGN